MKRLPIIDADAHVEECEATWDYLDDEFKSRRPLPVVLHGDRYKPLYGNVNAFWLIDGKQSNTLSGPGAMVSLTPTGSRAGLGKVYSVGSQELSDVPARLKDLDALGVEVQVLYPTLFNRPPTTDPDFLTALHRSYNTWLAGRCREAPERLKWVAIMPIHQVDAAIRELHRARELGAAAALLYPIADGRLLGDRQFHPFYAEANRLKMPLVSHIGWYFPELTQMCDNLFTALTSSITFPMLINFVSIVGGDVLDRFPNVRFGFLEAGATWLLYLIEHMDHYHDSNRAIGWASSARRARDVARSGQVYVTFEPEEAMLPQVIELIGEDHLMLSTDMPHAEGRDDMVRQFTDRTDVSDKVKEKICHHNPKRFYGLAV